MSYAFDRSLDGPRLAVGTAVGIRLADPVAWPLRVAWLHGPGSRYKLVPLATELAYITNSILIVRSSLGANPGPSAASEAPTCEVVLRRAVRAVRERMPADWSTQVTEKVRVAGHRIDAVIDVAAADGTMARLVVEAKRSVAARDLPRLVNQARSYASQIPAPVVPVVAARYFGPPARAWLEERGVSYVDATGNLHVKLDRPAMFLRDRGADRDPWRGPGRLRGSLKGPPAARVVRGLVDFAPPVSVPELVRRSGASTGATYRVVEVLEAEALVEREPRGPINGVRWRGLLERWSEDFGFQRSNSVGAYLMPRGLKELEKVLASVSGMRHAVTGSLAAHRLAPYAPARLAMIYVEDQEEAAERLGLRAVDSGANVLLASGEYDVVFDRSIEAGGIHYTAPSQTAVDLLTGPGRSPAEAQALLDWMEVHEHRWRS